MARAGTPLAEVEAALAAEGQMLPFEPWDARALTGANGVPTVGGMVAMNASGPRRIQAGACRDSLIGVRFVDGTGAVVKNGGRVMKNVTGLDLVKLMAGQPRHARGADRGGVQGAAAAGGGGERGARRARRGDGGRAMPAALATPYQVSGAAHAAGPAGRTLPAPRGLRGLGGAPGRALARALGALRRGARRGGGGRWAAIRDAARFAGREGAVWRVSVRPTDGPGLGARLRRREVVYDWAGGLLWVLAPEDFDLRAAMAGMAGHATLVRAGDGGQGALGAFHPEPAPVAALSAGCARASTRAASSTRGGWRAVTMQTNFTPEQLRDPATARSNKILADLRALRLLHRDLPDLPGAWATSSTARAGAST